MNSDTRQQIAALLHSGHSDIEVYRRTGAARTTIARHRKHLGLPGYHTTADSPACRHGHPFPQNLGRNEKGHLICRECVRASNRAAQRRAYIPAQPDEVAVDRAAAGDPPARLTPRERHAAIRRLDRQPLSAPAIAGRVGCSTRTVQRVRTKAVS
ncbi:hypothetical protein ABZ725_14130 [Streptomyces sp. NPDC006872]|uniref:hypothetical protein n=1 Tax=Streptomyces sp. NPDC006872 TaxID=3155720 RepID=UPI0033D17A06